MYVPDLENFKRLRAGGLMVPVYCELSADLETPVSVFLKLQNGSSAFLLESVERGEQVGRYSFIGTRPFSTLESSPGGVTILYRSGEMERVKLEAGQDPLHVVQRLLGQHPVAQVPGLPRFFGGAVGYLSYDMVRYFERLPQSSRDELGLPDCAFLFSDTVVVFDHVQRRMKVVTLAPPGDGDETAYAAAVDRIEEILTALEGPLPVDSQGEAAPCNGGAPALESNFTEEGFCRAVAAAKEYILAGDAFQIVLSQRLQRRTSAQPFAIYRALRTLNPSPYMFYLNFGPFQLIGSSPEMLVKLEESRAETRPIAGTRPRGANDGEDQALAEDLLADPKERAEHVMLVDLGRNDLGRVCSPGTVRVPLYMSIEKYSHVIHIVSSVEGRLQEGRDAFDFMRSAFPAGTVSGAPKIRAMEIIEELEGLRRGPYAGAVGYFSYAGNMDTCITIRTIVMKGDTVYLQGGAGIVADSVPEQEYAESLRKIEVLKRAILAAESARSRNRAAFGRQP